MRTLFPKPPRGKCRHGRGSLDSLLPASGYFFLAVGVLIAASRVFAGVHYVRDVLVGGVFGFFSVWIFFL